jgi:proteasome-associated ATPase
MLGKAAATSLAKLYGKESINTGFMYVKGPEILDKYVGETESTIRDMFYDANRHKEEHGYPAIIFLDEADAILASRGSFSVGIGNTIVPMFLTEMDGLEANSAIVIIATNRPDILDPAIVRDGRVDRKITIPRPNKKTGKAILKMNLAKVPLAEGLDIDGLAEEIATNFYSPQRMVTKDVKLRDVVNGAMLANCVDMAVSLAVKREINTGTRDGLQMDDCLMAIDRIQEQSHSVQHEIEITMNIKEKGGG